jgi:hypothetical protein
VKHVHDISTAVNSHYDSVRTEINTHFYLQLLPYPGRKVTLRRCVPLTRTYTRSREGKFIYVHEDRHERAGDRNANVMRMASDLHITESDKNGGIHP